MKSIDELITETGLNPTEWEFKRLCKTLAQIDEWESMLESGRYPEELDRHTAKETIAAEIESAKHECRSWRDYVLAKRKAVEVTAEVKIPEVRTKDPSDVGL